MKNKIKILKSAKKLLTKTAKTLCKRNLYNVQRLKKFIYFSDVNPKNRTLIFSV